MKFQFSDTPSSLHSLPHSRQYIAEDKLPILLEAVAKVGNFQLVAQQQFRQVWLDTFGARLALGQRLVIGVEEGRKRRLLCWQDGVPEKLIDDMTWRRSSWPSFYWQLDQSTLREEVKKRAGFWSLLVQSEFEVDLKHYRVEDKRGKTVARLSIARIHCVTLETKETIPDYYEITLSSLRGYEKKFEKLSAKMIPLMPAAAYPLWQPMLEHVIEGQSSKEPEIQSQQTEYEALSLMLRASLQGLELYHQGTLDDIDSEFLHQFRVNIRKTRSLLKEFKKALPAEIKSFADFFKQLNVVTTPVRDLDVYLLKLEDWTEEHGLAFRQQIAPFEQLLKRKRLKAFKAMQAFLSSQEYQARLQQWQDYLERIAAMDSQQTIQNYAAALIAKCYKRLLQQGGRLDEGSADEEYHALRLTFKRFRYLMEFFSDLFASPNYKSLYKQAKKLQTLLGDFQDITVQRAAMAGFAEELSKLKQVNHETFLALGQVTGEFSSQHDELKHQFHLQFGDFCDERHQNLVATLGVVE